MKEKEPSILMILIWLVNPIYTTFPILPKTKEVTNMAKNMYQKRKERQENKNNNDEGFKNNVINWLITIYLPPQANPYN